MGELDPVTRGRKSRDFAVTLAVRSCHTCSKFHALASSDFGSFSYRTHSTFNAFLGGGNTPTGETPSSTSEHNLWISGLKRSARKRRT